MVRFALAALVLLAACGGTPIPSGSGSAGGFGGAHPGGSHPLPNGDGGTLDAGTEDDAGTPADISYSLDCTGYLLDAALTYRYESHDDGHVLTECSGESPEGSGSQSNDWAPGAGEFQWQHDMGQCGYDHFAVEGGSGAGTISCTKNQGADSIQCLYSDPEGSDVSGTYAVTACSVTTPTE